MTDFLIVMSYDERSQIRGPCVAGPNSAFETTFDGLHLLYYCHIGQIFMKNILIHCNCLSVINLYDAVLNINL